MKSHHNLYAAIVLGIVAGLLSTYPFLLGPYESFFLWGMVALGLGFFAHGNKQAMWSGAYYGFFLSLSFLYSRFGGGSEKFLTYSVFVLGMSVLGIVVGVFTSLVGSKLKGLKQ